MASGWLPHQVRRDGALDRVASRAHGQATPAATDATVAACAADAACPAAPTAGAFAASANVNVSVLTVLGQNASVFDPAHFNFTGLWQGLDPRFAAGSPEAARATLSFQLAEDSPVYAAIPGFRRIPMECMGPWACSSTPAAYPRAATMELQGSGLGEGEGGGEGGASAASARS